MIFFPYHAIGYFITNDYLFLNPLATGRCGNNFESVISPSMCYGLISWAHVKFLSAQCHRMPLMISQHCVRYWLGAVRQQADTWANVDLDLCCHRASLGHNELVRKLPHAIHHIYISIHNNIISIQKHSSVALNFPLVQPVNNETHWPRAMHV